MIASIENRYIAELNRHLELGQELASAIDRERLDIAKVLETSKCMDEFTQQMKKSLALPDVVTAQQLITPDFRMPRLHEAAEQFAVVREAALARSAAFEAAKADAYSALASFLPSQDKFAQLTASLETPWVSTAQALSSFASVARLASIGNAIHSAPFGA